MNQPQGYMCPPSWIPTHLPPNPIPLGHPRALALNALFHALNLHLSSILHMVIYMFQCYPLKSSHPRLLPQSPKVCSYLCFFCCLVYRLIITIFLNSIYMLYWCFSLWLTSLYIIGSSFIHLIRTDSNAFFLYSIVYMYHNLLIHSSADGHLGCFHVLAIVNSAAMNIGVHVSLSVLVSSVYMPCSRIAGSYGSSTYSFLRKSHFSPWWLY